MRRKRRKLKHIGDLPKARQQHIFELLQSHTYEEVIEILKQPAPEGIGKKVSRSTLEVHYARGCEDEDNEALPEIKESADAWLHYKETGETTRFDEAALERLKLRTFELSGTLKDQKELTQLKTLFAILFAARLASVRERTAAVRERGMTLRETESKHRQEEKSARTKKQNRAHPEEPETAQSAEENPVATVVRACGGVPEFFGEIRPGERITGAVKRLWDQLQDGTFVKPRPAIETFDPGPWGTMPTVGPDAPKPKPSSETATTTPESDPSDPSDSAASEPTPPSELPASSPSPQGTSALSLQPLALPPPRSYPMPCTDEELNRPPSQIAALNYTHDRCQEYADYYRKLPRPITPETYEQHPYTTAFRRCPCGYDIPCPIHKPFPDEFWSLSPFDLRYMSEIRKRLIYQDLSMIDGFRNLLAIYDREHEQEASDLVIESA